MKNLILIGMPGAGKSTVGVILAKTLGMDFLDSDLAICRRAGTTLQDILDREGLDAFLDLEESVILDLETQNTVIATGGSAPMRERAMTHLKALGTVIYLQAPYEELHRRISNIKTRGIAFGPGETLLDLYQKRTPVYERWADVTVPWDGERNDLEAAVEGIIAALEERKLC